MAKADNMLAILWLLRSRRRVTAPEIAKALEISLRTAYRYIDALCASGVPIIAEVGPEGGYALPESFRGVPLLFDPGELTAVFQAAIFARYAGYAHGADLEQALAKLGRTLSPSQAADLRRRVATLTAVPQPRGAEVTPKLEPLELAVADCATIRIRYQKATATFPDDRTVDPYGLIYHGGLWYLVAFCHKRQSIRLFRVDRIHSLEPTGDHFDRPADFRPEVVFDQDWAATQAATGPFTSVRLGGSPAALTQLAEHGYLSHCRPEWVGRELHLQMDAKGLELLPSCLLPLGEGVTVLEPAHLRKTLASMGLKLALHHRKDRP